jgi:hypothetical protein
MTIGNAGRHAGVDVHLDPDECEVLMRLAEDAAQATYGHGTPNYFSICVRLGRCINAVLNESPASDVINP